jgi:hypothetical protein
VYDALGCAPDNGVQSAIATIGLHNDQVSAHFSRTSNYRLDELTVTDLEIGIIRILVGRSRPTCKEAICGS